MAENLPGWAQPRFPFTGLTPSLPEARVAKYSVASLNEGVKNHPFHRFAVIIFDGTRMRRGQRRYFS